MTEQRRSNRTPRSGPERGGNMGNLVGAGPSVVGVSGALRARDASRPRPKHLAEADRTLVVRRRPPDPPPPAAPTPKDLVS